MNDSVELYHEMDRRLLRDNRPSEFFAGLNDTILSSEHPFSMLYQLKSTPQSTKYHPEGNVWNHTMMVIDEAALRKYESSDARIFMWAALLHDIGKPGTTRIRKGKITSYDHDKLGAKLAEEFLRQFENNVGFIEKVSALVRYHMQLLYIVKAMPYAEIKNMTEQTTIADIALLGLCDRLGRLGADRISEEENVRMFIERCKESESLDYV